jgi:hypothetical protein
MPRTTRTKKRRPCATGKRDDDDDWIPSHLTQ